MQITINFLYKKLVDTLTDLVQNLLKIFNLKLVKQESQL